ncbi:MAG: hypothetical protein Q8M16_24660 [Pirellulaceae bacterium]|nr:hypothetical protein [Pirellulaceae bacterium]
MGAPYAGTLGMIAFVATIVRSSLHGIDAGTAIVTAVVYLAVFAFLGWLIGSLATHVVVESVTGSLRRELALRESSKSSSPTASGNG